MLFKITYWPGTADMPSDVVARLTPEHLAKIARVWECDFRTYGEAAVRSANRLSGTSDGCLIEPTRDQLKTCRLCGADFLKQRNQIYCSPNCRTEAAKRRTQ